MGLGEKAGSRALTLHLHKRAGSRQQGEGAGREQGGSRELSTHTTSIRPLSSMEPLVGSQGDPGPE